MRKVILGAVLVLSLASLAQAQAPGDEHARCSSVANNPNIVMLMNSHRYTDLLGDEGVWDQIDFDDNDPLDSVHPTFFKHNAGGVCRWSVRSCGYRSGWQDNWLFTQFISTAVPPNTTHTVRVIVEIKYTISSCRTRHSCFAVFRLYKYETDGPQPQEVYTNPANYESVRNKSGHSTLTQTITESIAVPPSVRGLYLAIRDNRSCITVSQVKVFRHQCRQKQEGLVIFPETAAPMDDNITVTSYCMPNSVAITEMDMVCDTNGQWTGSGQCRCIPGYYRVTVDRRDYCEPCPEGYYRSEFDPEDQCLPCPENTYLSRIAATYCPCLVGYFRNTEGLYDHCPPSQIEEDVSVKCTEPPYMPLNLRLVSSTDSSLSISWDPPISNGGRSDLYYQVHYSDPDNVGVMLEAECGAGCLTGTSCTISGLRPATTYVVRVSAHNGVSDQDQGGALARMTSFTLQTDIAPPSAVEEPQAFCEVVVWGKPAVTNGDILYYELNFDFGNGTVTNFSTPGEAGFFIIFFSYPPGTTVSIIAVNAAGRGPETVVTLPECTELDSIGTPLPPIVSDTPPPVVTDALVLPETTTVFLTVTDTSTTTATITTEVPSPTSILVTIPTTTTATATVTDHITSTTTEVVTSTVVSTVIAPTPSPVIVHVPTTVTETDTVTATETEHSTATSTETVTTTATETIVVEPSPIVVQVPTTVVSTTTATDYITATDTVTTVETTTVVVEPSPVLISVTTTVTTTSTTTDHTTATTTAFVTTTVTHTPEPTQLPAPTCNPTPCDSCCEKCDECNCSESPPTSPCPTICPESPSECAPCPTFTFYTSPNCASPDRKPGNVRNVRMLNCGMIVWDAPEDADCCHDKLTYKVRFFNGTSFSAAQEDNRKVMSVENSWIKFTSDDLPYGRPLQVMVKARRQDGVHSPEWTNAGPITESYVMDCPSFN